MHQGLDVLTHRWSCVPLPLWDEFLATHQILTSAWPPSPYSCLFNDWSNQVWVAQVLLLHSAPSRDLGKAQAGQLGKHPDASWGGSRHCQSLLRAGRSWCIQWPLHGALQSAPNPRQLQSLGDHLSTMGQHSRPMKRETDLPTQTASSVCTV